MGDSKPSLFARWFPNLHWRWTCPDSIDDIATDFIHNQNEWSLDDWPDVLAYDDGFPQRRRISAIYGVAEFYKNPNREDPPGPGWNRRLRKSVGQIDPEQLVDFIFDRVVTQIAKDRGV
ncbi:hypothetical protein [Rhodopirellula europaea]|uniref:hypothetical protein n=1 Tax=Rhodopirellula europaea TaxID=1263866 RepID=UPI003D29A1B6|tara:strand:+ start:2828 stop:3184 length:357 start_codon:yes stop_codon:yes gene_type:complete